MVLYPQILNEKQQKFLKDLIFLKKYPFYLAGGTALALQLNHRTSLDFDFYSQEKLRTEDLIGDFKKNFPAISLSKKQPEDTFQTKINGVNFSVFYYPYRLIGQLIDFPPFKLASPEDIAAMKIAAIVQRAKQRDFIDFYYLIEQLSLATILNAVYKKYPWYEENNQIVFKALTYFDEADLDQEISQITIFDKNLGWKKVKQQILIEVNKYLKNH